MGRGYDDWGSAQKLSGRQAPEPHFYNSYASLKPYLSVPLSFDSRLQWPGCIGAIRNEGNCGSNWAISAAGVLSDRFCISKNETVTLSPQWLVSCNLQNGGCAGGYIQYAWNYMKTHGIPLDACSPYTSSSGNSGTCSANCATFYTATDIEYYSTPYDIQAAILKGGPVQTAMTVYQDFMGYQSGIYRYQWGNALSRDAVKIVGWGNQGGADYWIAANSWGTNWGMNGFFNIQFGQCGIDSDAIAGSPNSP